MVSISGMPVIRGVFLLLACALAGCSTLHGGTARPPIEVVTTLRQADVRVRSVFDRLARANVGHCAAVRPEIGLILFTPGQYDAGYRDALRTLYGTTARLGVEAVLPGSPAASAGLRSGDAITAIDGAPIPEESGVALLDAATEQMEQAAADGKATLTVRDADGERSAMIVPRRTCDAYIDLKVDDDRDAGTDGKTIQLTTGLLNMVPSDDQLAAVIAHEFAHIVLRHPERMESADVGTGLFAGIGKNGAIVRRTEREADELSVFLMANAGFDPHAAAAFWRGPGRKLGGFLSDGTHAGADERAELLDSMVPRLSGQDDEFWEKLIASRDRPLR
ncbi:M48 family metallopeptidase [Stakelama saccharophila]|uniref:M48 family metallopeptidase n=1 Tax=Stakelama saccharophila TaxID=3075605 RepID=A0ABZ0B6X7_9SPHN|nr:M48 family metallopeptidase [Stakelama sp. W311]WNO53013.1 M48 family metallopeptidase [Stakelama sp. W311]